MFISPSCPKSANISQEELKVPNSSLYLSTSSIYFMIGYNKLTDVEKQSILKCLK